MRQLTTHELLACFGLEATPDAKPVQSLNTKLELLTSAYLDSLSVNPQALTEEQAHTLKILFELAR